MHCHMAMPITHTYKRVVLWAMTVFKIKVKTQGGQRTNGDDKAPLGQ